MEDMNEIITLKLPRGVVNTIIAHLWKTATCEMGNPIIEALRQQMEQQQPARNGRKANVSLNPEIDN